MDESVSALTTELLRTSSDPMYRRLRELLAEHEVDVDRDVLADLFPDDPAQEFGIVVTASRSVFTFVLHLGRSGDLNHQVSTAALADWTDISSTWETSPHALTINEAFELLPH